MLDCTDEEALSKEQQNALEKGHRLYLAALTKLDTSERLVGLDLLFESFEVLSEFVDDVNDIYYRIVFASVIQKMQDIGEFDLSTDCIDTKIDIYLQTLKWFQSAESYKTSYKSFLWGVFDKLGQIFLKGEELPQNDEVARICFQNNKLLKHPMADVFVDMFVQGENGKWVFIGKRPD